MLNEKNERELVYVVSVKEIRPIDGYDKVEYARIGAGWWVIVRKDQFKVDDLAIYFEIDSKVPEKEPFMFLEKRNFKVKTLKMCKVVSQGLLMSASDFGWGSGITPETGDLYLMDDLGNKYLEGAFLTKKLGVIYADETDNVRKAPSSDRYRSMQDRHKKIFRNKFVKKIMRYEFGRKVMFFLFGKKRDKKSDWPAWVKKTDEERVQNMPWLFPDCLTNWIATEKIDGTSTTFTMRNDKNRKLIVCSRNVVYDTPEKEAKNFYKESDGNVYLEMAEKYNMQDVLTKMLSDFEAKNDKQLEYITVQGETYGGNIQKRNYGPDHRLAVFNIIYGFKDHSIRLNPKQGKTVAELYGLEYVPIVDEDVYLPATCDEVVAMAHGESKIDGGLREGLVFRSYDGEQSFKAVDPEFLLKYHSC